MHESVELSGAVTDACFPACRVKSTLASDCSNEWGGYCLRTFLGPLARAALCMLEQAVNWMRLMWANSKNALLADVVGLGKTASVVTFIQCLRCASCIFRLQACTSLHLP